MAKARRARQNSGRRKPKRRPSGDIILIVCGGAKTEPSYFEGLRERWKLHSAQVHAMGRDPLRVVERAIRLRDDRRAEEEPDFDQVWCILDMDEHARLPVATEVAAKEEVKIALSTPCFEVWYLLHFEYTASPYANCKQVVTRLKGHLPRKRYSKAEPPLNTLMPELPRALRNAGTLRKHNKLADSENPSTDVDLLVKKLEELKRRPHGAQ